MVKVDDNVLPIVFSCSGSSNFAQLANQIAVELDRDQIAEMGCTTAVVGGIESAVLDAKSRDKIIVLDGCAKSCVRTCIKKQGIVEFDHYLIEDYGIKKRFHMNFLPDDVGRIKNLIKVNIEQ